MRFARTAAMALLATTGLITTTSSAQAATTDLLISEYIEGSSLNKAVELYNGTGAPIDLGAGDYTLEVYFNGSSSPGATVDITGAVADGDVFVIADDGADPSILAVTDQTTTSNLWNGDDAIVLRKGGAVVDSFGQVGVDPGSQWTGGGADDTLRRMADVCAGDTVADDAFDATIEYDSFAQNTFDGLGVHVANCGGSGGTPEIVISEIMYNPASAEDDWEWIEIFNVGDGTADLAGWVVDDNNSVAHSAANIAAGGVAAGTSAVLFNADDVTAADFTAAWGAGINLVPVTNWTALGLNNTGDQIGLWQDFASYSGDNGAHANAVHGVAYDDAGGWPSDDGAASIHLTDLTADVADGSNWALSTIGGTTPVNAGYESLALGGNSGADVGSPSATPPEIELTIGECGDDATFISLVQGDGASSPLAGETVVVEAVVVGDFQDDVGTDGDLNGFHLQEEDADADGIPATSEGLFVFQGSNPAVDVAKGDLVRVIGAVSEFNGLTEISSDEVKVCGPEASPTPATVSLPVESFDAYEAVEGMNVTIPQDLVISEYFNFDRFGEIVLTTERQIQPTAIVEPGDDAIALAAQQALARIMLDDGRSVQNPDPAIHPNGEEFTLDNLFRGGDVVANTTGVMDFAFGQYRIQPTQGADYEAVNERPAEPDSVGGNLEVASFNVLNYFQTIDSGPDICGPAQNQECRGADNVNERERQLAKIVAAMDTMDADVLGIIEVENTAGVEAMGDIVDGLNAINGAGTYSYVDTGTIGSDAIKVGFIYQPARATPVGDYAILDSTVDPRFDDTKNRPALAQTFVGNEGSLVTVAVNHLKSKGSPCDDVGDPDIGDGAGNCNVTRTLAAEALAEWMQNDPTGTGVDASLIIGDLNAYDKEDPIDALVDAGYTDLVAQFNGENAYSFVFDGKIGYLDHALADELLQPRVTGTTVWHINADEADLIDYDTSFKQDAQDALYAPDPFRSSDHDPVVVGAQYDIDDIIGDLTDIVADLRASGDLNKGQANALTQKLEQALVQIERGNVGSAQDILGGVEDQLAEFVDDGTLTPGQVAALLASINAVRSGL